MVIVTYPPKSTKYNQGDGTHNENKNKRETDREYSRETRWESCVDPDGKEWVDREEKSAEVVTN